MSGIGQTGGTRMVLLRARKRKQRVSHGAALLRRKREALVAELFRVARPAADTRLQIEERVRSALPALLEALALQGSDRLETSAAPRDVRVEIRTAQVWGLMLADITRRTPIARTLQARGTAPGLTSPLAARTATEFELLADLLIEAAPRSCCCAARPRLADTSRQVHGLEQRVLPTLEAQITRVQQALDEREREEKFRLKHMLARRASRRSNTCNGAS
jgi:V/A-type H+-transporting ATPase subunit D